MKLKINWGTGIFIAFSLMVCGMSGLVYVAIQQDFYLVDDNYYEKAINYQQHIEKVQNTTNLKEKVELLQSNNSLNLNFPQYFQDQLIEGTIYFYSPVNEKYDLNIPINLNNELKQVVALNQLPSGRYKIKLDWTAKEKSFYQEHEIIVIK